MLSTLIARVSDGLPLAASVDDDTDASFPDQAALLEGKAQLKAIARKLTPHSEPRMTIEGAKLTLHYLLSIPAAPSAAGTGDTLAFLTIVEKSAPRKLAFSYLDELGKEFERSFGDDARRPGLRPYAFQKFDTFIQRTKRMYQDSSRTSGLDQLNNELQDVTRIMTRNMEDILARGASLERMSDMSTSLRDESLKYRRAARRINIDAAIRKYAPLGFLGLFFLIVIWWKFF